MGYGIGPGCWRLSRGRGNDHLSLLLHRLFFAIMRRMRPSVALETQREAIRRIVASHRARNPRVFGSVARGEDTEDSDLDLLVDPTPDTSLLDIGAIRHELLVLLGIPVDVLTPKALPEKFRASVIAEARPV
jgi:hypothetical protein